MTMLKTLIGLTAAAAIIATSVTAHAFTLTNLDRMGHKFTIYVDDDDDEWDITIQFNETLSHLCPSGCTIAIEYGEEEDFEGHETILIIGGQLTTVQ